MGYLNQYESCDDPNVLEAIRTPTEQLNNVFAVFGHFYRSDFADQVYIDRSPGFRSVLEIRRIENGGAGAGKDADALFVMMNPGGSRPKDLSCSPRDWPLDPRPNSTFVRAVPDETQYQVMRLMEVFNWNLVRVINLSDVREPDSKRLRKLVDCLDRCRFRKFRPPLFRKICPV